MNFEQAFERLIVHEGGHVDHWADPGGETRYGISKRSYPQEDIAKLTLERARQIYWADYWLKCRCDELPEGIRFDVFDMAVNSGVGAAVRMVQRACGATVDGVLGPLTLQALAAMDPTLLSMRMNGARLSFMTDLPHWPAFGRGWARRIAQNLLAQ